MSEIPPMKRANLHRRANLVTKEKTKDRDESRNRFRPSVYQKKRSAKNPGLFEGKICVFNPGFLAEPAKEARKALIELVLPTHLTETGLTEATDRAQLSGALDVAGAGWAKPRPDLRSQLPQDTSAPALEAGPAIAPCFFSLPSPAPFPSSPACTDDTLARRWLP